MKTFAALLFMTSALSFGWGMRGSKIGHGKGALLPGMLLGFGAALITGDPKIMGYAWMLGAFGALGMFLGGGMSHGETINLVYKHLDPPRGYAGLTVKGFLWFSVTSAFTSFGLRILTMKLYTAADFIFLAAVICISRPVGTRLFNGKNSLYFSVTKKESWGQNLLIFFSFICVFAVRRDWFSIFVCIVSGLGGTVGWISGLWLYMLSLRRVILKKLSARGMCAGWKLMEFTLGAIAGLFSAAAFAAGLKLFPDVLSGDWFDSGAGLCGYIPQNLSFILAAAWFVLCAAHTLFCRLTAQKPWGEYAEDQLLDIIYCAVPFLLICLGSFHTAWFAVAAVPLYVLCEHFALDANPQKGILRAVLHFSVSLLGPVLSLAVPILPPFSAALFNIYIYLLYELCQLFSDKKHPKKRFPFSYGPRFTVNVHFVISAAVSTAAVCIAAA